MTESKTEVVVGALVLIVALGFLAYVAQATGFSRTTTGDLQVSASFRSAEGVSVGTDVRLAGVRIGAVTQMALDPETFRASTMLRLDRAVPIPVDSSAVVASEGLLGGTFIEIMPGGSLDVLGDGDAIIDTQGAVSLLQLLLQYVAGGSEAGQ
ncbi:MAG: outer membrane lipid asymmetry maintenance protein MlaD [Rubellimicrobium sp.]|nr:outer membrane lipid asymmetry maintenance protein MlaD [Rubellimicrobium sp.]